MTDWDKCQDKPMIAWGEDASPDAQWSVCQDAPTLEWSVCDASPDTDWPTCQLPPDTDWGLPIIEPPGVPIGPVYVTQVLPEEVRLNPVGARVTQFVVEETRISPVEVRVTSFVVSEIRESNEYQL